MDRAEFTLSRPVCLSLPVEEVDKLLREKDGRCALVYLALLRAGGKPFPAESIGLTERELRQTMERLCALGLVSAAGKSSPAPAGRTAPAADKPGAAEPKLVPAAELPQYTAEDIASRMLSDEPMQTVRREAEQLYGRKLTTPEMNMLLELVSRRLRHFAGRIWRDSLHQIITVSSGNSGAFLCFCRHEFSSRFRGNCGKRTIPRRRIAKRHRRSHPIFYCRYRR